MRLSIRHSSGDVHDRRSVWTKLLANRLPTRITALAGLSGDKLEPAGLTLQKRSGADHCYDFSAELQTVADEDHRQPSVIRHHHHGKGGWRAGRPLPLPWTCKNPFLPSSPCTARGHFRCFHLESVYLFAPGACYT